MNCESRSISLRSFILAVALICCITLRAWAAPLTFRRALELAAARNSSGVAAAEQMRARAAYQQARSAYLPQLVVGSGLGASFGFPLSLEGSAPSLFNVNYQSFLINPAQREFSRSAKLAWDATQASTDNQRRDTLLETAVTYVQLDSLTARTHTLREQQRQASSLIAMVSARVEEGVDPQLELTRARLTEARIRMALADAQGSADVLRERLAQLTGLPAQSIETETESIPEIPDASTEDDLVESAVASSSAVKAAEQQALAKEARARGEHKLMYPAVDAVAQYAMLSRFNNYDEFFRKFQRHNATLGVAIRFPFLNFPQRASAQAADAEAVQARRQADATKNQVSTETLRLARAVQQLAAAEQVAQLEYQLAQGQAEAMQVRIEAAAPPVPGSMPPSPRDLQLARIEAGQRYAAYLDASFELQKARLQLLRAVGRLDSWALGSN